MEGDAEGCRRGGDCEIMDDGWRRGSHPNVQEAGLRHVEQLATGLAEGGHGIQEAGDCGGRGEDGFEVISILDSCEFPGLGFMRRAESMGCLFPQHGRGWWWR